MATPSPTAADLRAAFDAASSFTVGLEEEVMLLDPATHDLAPCARELLELLPDDGRFKLELPASQLEIMLAPRATVGEAIADLARARRTLAGCCADRASPAAAGVHPHAPAEGELNRGERYDRAVREYGRIARRQLVCALQVHVAVPGAARALAVYNALRSYLPELTALAANAPLYRGADTGLATVRPKIAEALPRQGVPPSIDSWDDYAEALRWGAAAGGVPEPRRWWWEARPHPSFGTIELRVPDAQSTVTEAAGVTAVAQSLVAWLADRHDAGEDLPVAPAWRIEENRWAAIRHGLDGELADLETGDRSPTRDRLGRLLAELTPAAGRLGCAAELEHAVALVTENGSLRQRRVAAAAGVEAVAPWLAARFLADPVGSKAAAPTPADPTGDRPLSGAPEG